MRSSHRLTRLTGPTVCAVLSIAITACAQPPAGGTTGASQSSPTAAPKVLIVALQREPTDFDGYGTTSTTAGGAQQVLPMVHDGLTYNDNKLVKHPLLAADFPQIARGSWKVSDEGTMETTWKLRPNVKWHDGTLVTPEDFLFGFTVSKDRDLPTRQSTVSALQTGMSFPDPLSLTVSWSALYFSADLSSLKPLPRHILEESYKGPDKMTAFLNHPYFTTGYVGVGPYKLDKWERNSEIALSRWEGYYLGRPPLDRVIVKIIGDPQTAVANILAGAVDIVLPTGVDLDAALEVQKRWEGTGNVVRYDVTGRHIQFEVQFRPELAKPTAGLRTRDIRLALYQALDRSGINDVGSRGLGPLADSWVQPGEALRKDVEASIPKYPYDLAAAQRLLAQNGWTKGADGVLVHQSDGERFELSIWANQAIGWDKIATVAADQWKGIGVQTTVATIPPANIGNRQYESGYTGLFVTNVNVEQFWAQNTTGRYDSRFATGPANNFNGSNRGAYIHPQIDAIYQQIYVTLDPAKLLSLQQQLLKTTLDDVAQMPLYWEVAPVLKLKGVKDHEGGITQTWFFFNWDKT